MDGRCKIGEGGGGLGGCAESTSWSGLPALGFSIVPRSMALSVYEEEIRRAPRRAGTEDAKPFSRGLVQSPGDNSKWQALYRALAAGWPAQVLTQGALLGEQTLSACRPET